MKKTTFIGIFATNENPEPLTIFDGKHLAETFKDDKNLITQVEPDSFIVFVPFGEVTEIVKITFCW